MTTGKDAAGKLCRPLHQAHLVAATTNLEPVRFRSAAEIQTEAEAYERENAERIERKAERIERGQHLYAKIKRSSKYYGQTPPGALFAVFLEPGDSYVVKGGPGGQYRLTDVNLFIKDDDGRELKIS